MKTFCLRGVYAKEIYLKLCVAYVQNKESYMAKSRWINKFKCVHGSVKDALKSRRWSSATS